MFGRTDLRKCVSEAKFDKEADFEVRSAVAPSKPCRIGENDSFHQTFSLTKVFWRRKMKCRESSGTRFPEFSWRADVISRGKQMFEVWKSFQIRKFLVLEQN